MNYRDPKIKESFYSDDEVMNSLCHKIVTYRAQNRAKILETLTNEGYTTKTVDNLDAYEFDEAYTMYVCELLEKDNWRDYALFKRVYSFNQPNDDWERIEKNLQETKYEIFKLIEKAWKPKTR
jgi:hypothetical protein